MGLLIGASCLTLVEFFDLILYNAILKCMEKKKRTNSVQTLHSVNTIHVKQQNKAELSTPGPSGPYYLKRPPSYINT